MGSEGNLNQLSVATPASVSASVDKIPENSRNPKPSIFSNPDLLKTHESTSSTNAAPLRTRQPTSSDSAAPLRTRETDLSTNTVPLRTDKPSTSGDPSSPKTCEPSKVLNPCQSLLHIPVVLNHQCCLHSPGKPQIQTLRDVQPIVCQPAHIFLNESGAPECTVSLPSNFVSEELPSDGETSDPLLNAKRALSKSAGPIVEDVSRKFDISEILVPEAATMDPIQKAKLGLAQPSSGSVNGSLTAGEISKDFLPGESGVGSAQAAKCVLRTKSVEKKSSIKRHSYPASLLSDSSKFSCPTCDASKLHGSGKDPTRILEPSATNKSFCASASVQEFLCSLDLGRPSAKEDPDSKTHPFCPKLIGLRQDAQTQTDGQPLDRDVGAHSSHEDLCNVAKKLIKFQILSDTSTFTDFSFVNQEDVKKSVTSTVHKEENSFEASKETFPPKISTDKRNAIDEVGVPSKEQQSSSLLPHLQCHLPHRVGLASSSGVGTRDVATKTHGMLEKIRENGDDPSSATVPSSQEITFPAKTKSFSKDSDGSIRDLRACLEEATSDGPTRGSSSPFAGGRRGLDPSTETSTRCFSNPSPSRPREEAGPFSKFPPQKRDASALPALQGLAKLSESSGTARAETGVPSSPTGADGAFGLDARRQSQLVGLTQSKLDDWIQLNVGGEVFLTSRATLILEEPESMLAKMFGGHHPHLSPASLDPQGRYIIDRSPRYFAPLLNYLRTGALVLDSGVNPEGVLLEAKFYGLEGVVPHLEQLVADLRISPSDKPLTRHDVVGALVTTPPGAPLRFQAANLRGADLSWLDLSAINFKYADLRGADLRGANLSSCNLERAKLQGAQLSQAQLLNVRLLCADVRDACLRGCVFENPSGGTPPNLEGVNLRNSDLEGSMMAHVNLRVSTLKNANLRNCDLRMSVLAGADLENCDLSGSNLLNANLRGANLKNASFELMQTPLHMSQTCGL